MGNRTAQGQMILSIYIEITWQLGGASLVWQMSHIYICVYNIIFHTDYDERCLEVMNRRTSRSVSGRDMCQYVNQLQPMIDSPDYSFSNTPLSITTWSVPGMCNRAMSTVWPYSWIRISQNGPHHGLSLRWVEFTSSIKEKGEEELSTCINRHVWVGLS